MGARPTSTATRQPGAHAALNLPATSPVPLTTTITSGWCQTHCRLNVKRAESQADRALNRPRPNESSDVLAVKKYIRDTEADVAAAQASLVQVWFIHDQWLDLIERFADAETRKAESDRRDDRFGDDGTHRYEARTLEVDAHLAELGYRIDDARQLLQVKPERVEAPANSISNAQEAQIVPISQKSQPEAVLITPQVEAPAVPAFRDEKPPAVSNHPPAPPPAPPMYQAQPPAAQITPPPPPQAASTTRQDAPINTSGRTLKRKFCVRQWEDRRYDKRDSSEIVNNIDVRALIPTLFDHPKKRRRRKCQTQPHVIRTDRQVANNDGPTVTCLPPDYRYPPCQSYDVPSATVSNALEIHFTQTVSESVHSRCLVAKQVRLIPRSRTEEISSLPISKDL